MRFLVKIVGEQVVREKLTAMAATRSDMRIALQLVADYIMGVEARIFSGQGRRGGGSWRADSPEWLQRKLELGLDPRILHATLALRDAMSVRDAEHQVLEVTSQSVALGTDLPYARRQNRDRPFNELMETDRAAIRKIVKRSLIASFHAGR